MPTFRMVLERDALIRGHVDIEASSLQAARELASWGATKHGVRVEGEVVWDETFPILLDSVECVDVIPLRETAP